MQACEPGTTKDGRTIRRVPFDDTCLQLSSRWLKDPELVWLIRAAPEFDPAVQSAWYASLPTRTDYAVWGIAVEDTPIGVMGIKHIGVDDGAEYFMYIGERSYWRLGIARWAMKEIKAEVASRGLTWVYGKVAHYNERSMATDLALGMRPIRDLGEQMFVGIKVDDPTP